MLSRPTQTQTSVETETFQRKQTIKKTVSLQRIG